MRASGHVKKHVHVTNVQVEWWNEEGGGSVREGNEQTEVSHSVGHTEHHCGVLSHNC